MLLVGVDGRVEADTRAAFPVGASFPYADLVDDALQQPAAAIVASRGGADWMVVVPVFAPNLVGFIAAAIPVDDRLLAQLQLQSALPKGIELASIGPGGRWRLLAQGSERAGMVASLQSRGRDALPLQPRTEKIGDRE